MVSRQNYFSHKLSGSVPRQIPVLDTQGSRAVEGEKMARMVTDFLGDRVLMYSSDYPHAECRFPESTDKVLGWKSLGDEVMRKMYGTTRRGVSESARRFSGCGVEVYCERQQQAKDFYRRNGATKHRSVRFCRSGAEEN
jgi:hypothetical protein